MKASIDRFEGEYAVLIVDGREQRKKRSELEKGAREGDVVDLATGEVDEAATRRLLLEVKAARDKANKGKPPPSGNFDL